MPLASGTLLNNRYRIVSILGQGGMGAVYRASDEHLLIPVAVKENLFLTEEYGRQFRSEATILAGLRHPNLPHVSDYFSMENQGQYLVMDYIEGEDLRQRMERMGVLPEREAILIGISICDALTYLHTRRAPIVHRDIKPGNIKVTPDGQAVLVDFGLAKIMQGSQVTSTGARAMTPGYSPPEQYGTARTDPRSDIYSLGATLYAALTGVIPEDGLARMTGKSELTPIRELSPKINRKLAETIEQALEVDPDDRFQSAEDFKRSLIESGELATFYQERPSIAPPPVPGGNGESSGVLNEMPAESGASKTNGRSGSVRRRQKNRRLARTLVSGAVLLAVGASLLFALNPNINKAVLGYFTASPFSTRESTEIASAATRQPLETGEPVSGSPSEENPQDTPTPTTEPTTAATPTITLTPEPTATPRGGGRGQIAFASDRNGGIMQIYLMDVTTRKPQPITGLKDGACQPTWAPDGLRIAFTSPCAKKHSYAGANIYTINVDAAGKADRNSIVQVTRSLEGAYDPAWSPDGDRIAYTSLQGGRSTIWIKNLKDGTEKELSLPRSVDKQPAWDPSGFQLAFVRQFITSQVIVMPDTGESQNEFTVRSPVNNLWPAWSADGQVIYFSQFTADNTGPVLFYKRLEDRNKPVEVRVPISGNGPVAQVNPSPDGFWLAFESWDQQANHDIYIMNVNGANQERLTTDPGYDFGPVWRPLQAAAPAQP